MKKTDGFTLIELVVYLGLFAVVISAGLTSAFVMLEAAGRGDAQIYLLNEGNFLLGKINYLLNFSSGEAVSNQGKKLDFTLSGGSKASLEIINQDLVFTSQGGQPQPLNGSRAKLSALEFRLKDLGLSGKSVAVDFTLEGRTDQGKIVSKTFSLSRTLFK